ncbi:MAG: hypothetical protein U1D67_02500 [Dehalococcoidia bacterium]|nr:hypothetical protein [Dehalococcoidia bacterium]MDZ4245969.1 hypothetical protein [Dehalococcoidia bacterium]
MKENLLRLKTIMEERERVFNKVAKDYDYNRKNPPPTMDGAIVGMEKSVAALFNSHTELVEAYREYITALEKESGIQ